MGILVTGGAGFIGSAFVRYVLATSDDTVTIYDALTYAAVGGPPAAFAHEPRVRYVHGDVTDREALLVAMDGHEVVVHFAAESHVDRSLLDPQLFMRTNRDGTATVCDVACQVGISRLVHISTDEVYGPAVSGAFREVDPLLPTSPYAASKAAADLIVQAYSTESGLPAVISRGCNVFGPRQHIEKLIGHIACRLIGGQRALIHGDGLHVRDWLHVDDACRAVDALMRFGALGETYNVSAGNPRTTLEVAEGIVDQLGLDRSVIDLVTDRPGNDRRYSLDGSKLAALGWRPQVDFDEALGSTVDWYLDNAWWWRPLLPEVSQLGHRLRDASATTTVLD